MGGQSRIGKLDMLHTHRLRASRQHLPELERELAALDEAGKAGKAIHLSARMVGLFVQLDREERGWKQQSLASLAGVSLSTIQRVERGEPTRESALVRIEQALGHDVGKYSAKRVPLPISECKKLLVEQKLESAQTVQIKIGLIKSTSQLAAMTRCNIITIDDRQVSDDIKKDIYEFRDLLESAALVVAADQAHILPSVVAEPIKRREIYSSLLARIIEIGNAHKLYVVGGTYSADTNWEEAMPTVKVAVLGFYPRSVDPGILKRRTMTVPKQLDMDQLWSKFETRMSELSAQVVSEIHGI